MDTYIELARAKEANVAPNIVIPGPSTKQSARCFGKITSIEPNTFANEKADNILDFLDLPRPIEIATANQEAMNNIPNGFFCSADNFNIFIDITATTIPTEPKYANIHFISNFGTGLIEYAIRPHPIVNIIGPMMELRG